MPAIEPFSHLLDVDLSMLSHAEKILFEADLFTTICEELKEIFREKYRNYILLMKFNIGMENSMLDARLTQDIINDILSTKEYTLKGIAYYTDSFEEVVEEFATGLNTNPSATFLRKLICLHRSVRRELYNYIIKKIKDRYLS